MKNADQPAHPIVGIAFNESHKGLTKREYFAAMAMQGLLSSCDADTQGMEPNEGNVQYFIGLSIKAADELLKQLES